MIRINRLLLPFLVIVAVLGGMPCLPGWDHACCVAPAASNKRALLHSPEESDATPPCCRMESRRWANDLAAPPGDLSPISVEPPSSDEFLFSWMDAERQAMSHLAHTHVPDQSDRYLELRVLLN